MSRPNRLTEFHAALDRGIFIHAGSMEKLAKSIGVKKAAVYHWLNGRRRPTKGNATLVIMLFPPVKMQNTDGYKLIRKATKSR